MVFRRLDGERWCLKDVDAIFAGIADDIFGKKNAEESLEIEFMCVKRK